MKVSKVIKIFIFFLFIALITVSLPLQAQEENPPAQFSLELSDVIPVNPVVMVGELTNGLKYFIRENSKPENRGELRLVVNVGSILEDEDQQGLAHFVEHMAFNGTKNFAKQELVDYLESIGMKFGPEINAYTSFDETVYMLQVPTDSAEILEKAFQILEDWAHNVSLVDEEIDKERGVIVEEWRLGRGAGARMQDKQFPILFKDSQYAKRLPIGQMEIIESFEYETIRRYYKDWYRPDLMAVIAIGDFDKSRIENLIQKYFSKIPERKEKRERKNFPVPDHKETLFAIASDPEAGGNQISVYYKMELHKEITVGDYRSNILEGIYSIMLNQRLGELNKLADPPFIYGYAGKSPLTRTKDSYSIGAAVKENGIKRGLKAVLIEAAKVKKFGFTETELERTKTLFLRFMERSYLERDKTKSVNYASEYIRHFLTGEPIPGIEYEFALFQKYVPGVGLDEINRLADLWISDQNRVIMVNTPEKEGVEIPTEDELLAVFREVDNMDVTAYDDKVSDLPLISEIPSPGGIVSEKKIAELGITEWQLSNGITVVLKPTDFKNDEIRFDSFSPGGHSLASDEDYMPAISASILMSESGIGNFNKIELDKYLSGKVVSVSPYIAALSEGVSGMASPKDIETLFQLIYLTFTAPRKDSTAFISYQTRMKSIFENKEANPGLTFSDTIQVTMSQYHYRSRPLTEELLDEFDLNVSMRIYKERFGDASDFTFLFVGNFEPDKIKPFVATYLASLPTISRTETWKDVGIRPPKGIINKTVKKGIEPISRVNLIFTGPYQYSRLNNYFFGSMVSVLEIKLREVLREKLSGTYGVRVSSSSSKYPYEGYRISISFGCDPERVDELNRTVIEQIDSLKNFGTEESYLKKVTEAQLRSYETNLKENGYWMSVLNAAYEYGLDPRAVLTYPDRVKQLNLEIVQKTALKYLSMENYARFVLMPADK